LPMMICLLLLGILFAVRGWSCSPLRRRRRDRRRRLRPSSTNQERSTREPTNQRAIVQSARFVLLACRGRRRRPGQAPLVRRRSHRAVSLRRFDERAKRRLCPLRRRHLLSARPILVHTRQLIQTESGRCGDVEVHTSVCVPVAFAAAALSSAAHRPSCSDIAVLSSSKRPPQPTPH
jgi:hypothetical protein